MATTISGLLFTWGLNVYGELGIGNSEDQYKPMQVEFLQEYTVTSISAGQNHSAAVTQCGKLFTWGFNPDERLMKLVEYADSKKKVPLSCYYPQHIELALEGVPKLAKQVTCGLDHTLVVCADGYLCTGGGNLYG